VLAHSTNHLLDLEIILHLDLSKGHRQDRATNRLLDPLKDLRPAQQTTRHPGLRTFRRPAQRTYRLLAQLKLHPLDHVMIHHLGLLIDPRLVLSSYFLANLYFAYRTISLVLLMLVTLNLR
jgi:hypothetical protein